MNKGVIKVVLALMLIAGACGSKEGAKQAESTDFNLYSLDGNQYRLWIILEL